MNDYKPRLKDFYKEHVTQALKKRFGYKNVMEIPKLEKIVVNIGVGDAVQNSKALEWATEELKQISGQKPSIRKARK